MKKFEAGKRIEKKVLVLKRTNSALMLIPKPGLVAHYWLNMVEKFMVVEVMAEKSIIEPLWLKNPSLKCPATISNSEASEKSGLSTLISENLDFMYDWPPEGICALLIVITLLLVQVRCFIN